MTEFLRLPMLGLPELASEQGRSVDDLIIYVHWLMIILFVGWLAYFGYALVRFRRSRNPKADYFGVKNHASNYIEGAVALVEGILLIGVAIPFWARAVDKFPKESESTVLQVVAQQFAWNVRYPGKDGVLGKTDHLQASQDNPIGLVKDDPAAKDDLLLLNQIYLPKDRPVRIQVRSMDVIHSFFLPNFRVKQDAMPGMTIDIWFTPTETGDFEIACAEHCGLGHYRMRGQVHVVPAADLEKAVAEAAQ